MPPQSRPFLKYSQSYSFDPPAGPTIRANSPRVERARQAAIQQAAKAGRPVSPQSSLVDAQAAAAGTHATGPSSAFLANAANAAAARAGGNSVPEAWAKAFPMVGGVARSSLADPTKPLPHETPTKAAPASANGPDPAGTVPSTNTPAPTGGGTPNNTPAPATPAPPANSPAAQKMPPSVTPAPKTQAPGSTPAPSKAPAPASAESQSAIRNGNTPGNTPVSSYGNGSSRVAPPGETRGTAGGSMEAADPILSDDGKTQIGVGRRSIGDMRAATYAAHPEVFQPGSLENAAFVAHAKQFGETSAHQNAGKIVTGARDEFNQGVADENAVSDDVAKQKEAGTVAGQSKPDDSRFIPGSLLYNGEKGLDAIKNAPTTVPGAVASLEESALHALGVPNPNLTPGAEGEISPSPGPDAFANVEPGSGKAIAAQLNGQGYKNAKQLDSALQSELTANASKTRGGNADPMDAYTSIPKAPNNGMPKPKEPTDYSGTAWSERAAAANSQWDPTVSSYPDKPNPKSYEFKPSAAVSPSWKPAQPSPTFPKSNPMVSDYSKSLPGATDKSDDAMPGVGTAPGATPGWKPNAYHQGDNDAGAGRQPSAPDGSTPGAVDRPTSSTTPALGLSSDPGAAAGGNAPSRQFALASTPNTAGSFSFDAPATATTDAA